MSIGVKGPIRLKTFPKVSFLCELSNGILANSKNLLKTEQTYFSKGA